MIKAERELALKLDASNATHPIITLDGPFFDSWFFSLRLFL